ncbi:hypothetical protein HDA32_005373 [Spinactinospora alkalitolerans]|uniref:Uncharacterized protein n=1 Tax=Spinactinospora alkalitolerans TaxID=687207 RepID=A0A852U5W0_9ACTN|nr:hypothetical protein [Spinactinospora alkalitolerans]NYE50253.1 hypothetical protein [Spinactinospora alkalitolerans]
MLNLSQLPNLAEVTDDDRAHQGRAAAVLLHLLALDLPGCDWSITHTDGMPLDGHLPTNDRAGLQAWADAFGVPVDWQHLRGKFPQARFTVEGIPVCVWVKADPAEVEPEPAAPAVPAAAVAMAELLAFIWQLRVCVGVPLDGTAPFWETTGDGITAELEPGSEPLLALFSARYGSPVEHTGATVETSFTVRGVAVRVWCGVAR